jgi:hypothetical protein
MMVVAESNITMQNNTTTLINRPLIHHNSLAPLSTYRGKNITKYIINYSFAVLLNVEN